MFKLHVWIHSNYDTGKPDSIDVFDIDGKVNMYWFSVALEENNGPELAEQFFEYLQKTDESAWFNCESMTEDATGIPDRYIKVIGMAEPGDTT